MLAARDPGEPVPRLLSQRLRTLLRELVRRGQADGDLRDDVTGSDVLMVLLAVGRIGEGTSGTSPAYARRFLALQLDALAPGGAPLPGKALTERQLELTLDALAHSRARARAQRPWRGASRSVTGHEDGAAAAAVAEDDARDASLTSVFAALAANTNRDRQGRRRRADRLGGAVRRDAAHGRRRRQRDLCSSRSAAAGDPRTSTHPLGYGPERWYWALLAAAGMFVVGGAVSICQGPAR